MHKCEISDHSASHDGIVAERSVLCIFRGQKNQSLSRLFSANIVNNG